MKFYYPKNKQGEVIGFKTPESQVYDKLGRSLTDKMRDVENTKATKQELETEKSRINNLVVAAGPGDAELTDIRTGADTVNYTTAGEAVREQFKKKVTFGPQSEVLEIKNPAEKWINEINEKGVNTLSSIPDDYTTLSYKVNELSSDMVYCNEFTKQEYDVTRYPIYGFCNDGTLFAATEDYKTVGYQVHNIDKIYIHQKQHSDTRVGYFMFTTTSYLAWSNPTYIVGNVYTSDYHGEIDVPKGANWLLMSIEQDDTESGVYNSGLSNRVRKLEEDSCRMPELRNGSLGNIANTNAVGFLHTKAIKDECVMLKYDLPLADGEKILWCVCTYNTVEAETSAVLSEATYRIYNDDKYTDVNYVLCDFTEAIRKGKNAYAVSLHVFGADGNPISQRVGVNAKDIIVSSIVKPENLIDIDKRVSNIESNVNTSIVRTDLLTAKKSRYIGNTLTIAHLTDIHADSSVYKRIVDDIKMLGDAVDDAICTGDMVANTSVENIASWWTSDVMTCIGNHDSATYSSSTGYNWTALTMNQRSSKYIEPWENDWGIVHTAGTSYYYKDYPNAFVRMIVLDNMLYMGTPGTEATTQTAWLVETMESARALGYHILIAVHAVHGGSVAVPCSFSKYGYNNSNIMPTNIDCDLPQIVIDTVATEITKGCVFIGYICGHTHQDMIWDVTGDKSQLMYCLTCTSQNDKNQWVSSDLARQGINNHPLDAYNLVTIATNRSIIKIVRCGGADIDTYMRERKYICIEYTTGTIISE